MDGSPDPLTLLRLQMDWGVDEALAELPRNRLGEAGATAVTAQPLAGSQTGRAPTARPATPPSALPHTPTPEAGAGMPESVATLAELIALIRDFSGCRLRDTATNPVTPTGDPASGLLIIGDPPGAEDDRSGRPFSGPAGEVLDRILFGLGRRREEILLAPLVPWRPPGNRPPTDAELAQCLPLLHHLIRLTTPARIVLSGILPVRCLLGAGTSIRRHRGQWRDMAVPGLPRPIPTLPTAGLGTLKSAQDRRSAWADWRLLHRSIHPTSEGF